MRKYKEKIAEESEKERDIMRETIRGIRESANKEIDREKESN